MSIELVSESELWINGSRLPLKNHACMVHKKLLEGKEVSELPLNIHFIISDLDESEREETDLTLSLIRTKSDEVLVLITELNFFLQDQPVSEDAEKSTHEFKLALLMDIKRMVIEQRQDLKLEDWYQSESIAAIEYSMSFSLPSSFHSIFTEVKQTTEAIHSQAIRQIGLPEAYH